MRAQWHWLIGFSLVLALLSPTPGAAGILAKADIERAFPDALRVLDKDGKIPIWPIVKLDGPTETVVAYVFESIDLAPIPGFAGVPFDLLIALDRNGEFLEVRVLSQHEPVFLDGLGPEPLFRFVEQYKGKSIKGGIKIASAHGHSGRGSSLATLDGVAKATASIRIVNETVLAAALRVARAKLGYAAGRSAAEVGQVREAAFEPLSWQALLERGYVRHFRLTNAEVERAFRGSAGEGTDAAALASPGATGAEIWYAYVNAPSIGRNLLGEAAYRSLKARLEPGQHAIWLMTAGRYSFVGEDYTRGAVPDAIVLRQAGLPIGIRDMDMDLPAVLAGAPRAGEVKLMKIVAQAGFDPALPWQMALRVTRKKGMIFPEVVSRDFGFDYRLPGSLFDIPESAATRAWKAVWRARLPDLTIVALSLAVLTVALAGQRRLTRKRQRLNRFRWGFVIFTLGFLGWHAQGQLSIVNLVGLIKGARNGWDLSFFLYDPVTLVIAVYALLTLAVWGRGTFCGWLCPFGALQEVIAKLGQRLRLPQLHIDESLDSRLVRVKYGVLALILGAAMLAPEAGDRLVEIEPFKTAITLLFVRSLPAVLYAVALLLLGAFAYKAFCRYLCPLGAGLALLGSVRRWDWLPRRRECGAPCRLCEHRCEYRAIGRDGAIRYSECFQCLDCVAIHDDRTLCAPLLLFDRKGRSVPSPAPLRPMTPK
ncbi:MAG: 4Fe-4S binding protein [Hyphomicrobiaceae bacterium]